MSGTWFTSDLHIGHEMVANLRGFDCATDQDIAMAKNWRRMVGADDHIWVLGDLCMGSPNTALSILGELPGHKHLITGNHDACWPGHRDAHKNRHRYFDVFDSVQEFGRRRINGQTVLMSHFPYSADSRAVARHVQYRLVDLGGWLLHGHTHSDVKLDARQVNVALDAWGMCPVNMGSIAQLMGVAA